MYYDVFVLQDDACESTDCNAIALHTFPTQHYHDTNDLYPTLNIHQQI